MRKNENIWLIISLALISIFLLFPAEKSYAWGSSRSSGSDSYSGETSYSSGSTDYDSSYGGRGGTLTEDDCRNCHENLDYFPQLVDTNPGKHHILVGLHIPSWTIAPYGNAGENYDCFSCHTVDQTDDLEFQASVIRDCLQCHPVRTVTGYSGNVHHETPTARARRCGVCHDWGWSGGGSTGYGR